MELLDKELMLFIEEYLNVKREKLSPKVELARDLGLDGDDAVEFIELFSKRFSVNMADFNFSKYFGPEAGWNPLTFIFSILFKKEQLTPITLADLNNSIKKGKWVIP